MSYKDLAKEIAIGYCYGVRDSLLGFHYLFSNENAQSERKPKINPEGSVKSVLIKNSILNGLIYIGSFYTFSWIIMTLLETIHSILDLKDVWDRETKYVATFLFTFLWGLPLFLVSKSISCIWFFEIASKAYKQTQGNPIAAISLGYGFTEGFFSFIVQIVCYVQICVLSSMISGPIVVFKWILLSLLNSFYAFEYRWTFMGMRVYERLRLLQKNWPYYVGFGTIGTICTLYPEDFFGSASAVGLTFPIFIMSANNAVPRNKYNGPRLPSFEPAIWITDKCFHWAYELGRWIATQEYTEAK